MRRPILPGPLWLEQRPVAARRCPLFLLLCTRSLSTPFLCPDLPFLHLQVAYFVNSGTEANEMALLMARLHSGNHDIISLRNAYHGISEATMGLLGQR